MTEDDGETEPPADATARPESPRGLLWEMLGCCVPLGVIAAFLFLVMWGYRALFGPERPVPVEAGEVQALALQGGDGKEHAGRRCRVYAEWIAIEVDGAVVLVPRDRVQSLRLSR